jgi:hypothetical protein
MTSVAHSLLAALAAHGVTIPATPTGMLKVGGQRQTVAKLTPEIRAAKTDLLADLIGATLTHRSPTRTRSKSERRLAYCEAGVELMSEAQVLKSEEDRTIFTCDSKKAELSNGGAWKNLTHPAHDAGRCRNP